MTFATDVLNAAWATFLLNKPLMQVTQSTAQTFTTSVAAPINWTTVVVDNFSAANLANNNYTIPVAGWWRCSVLMNFATSATGVRYTNVTKNGTSQLYPSNRTPVASNIGAALDILMQCAVGDVIQATGLQNSGGNLTSFISGNYQPIWTMEWVRS